MRKPPNKRLQQKRETRLRIVAVTRELIAEQGLNALKTYEVASRANIAHGSVFVHFSDKETLLIHTIEAFGSSLVKQIHKSTESNKGLQIVLETHLNILQQNEAFYAALVEGRRLLPDQAAKILLSIQSAVSFHIAKSAEKGMREGIIKIIPAHLLFNTWLGLVHYYLTNRELFSPGRSVLSEKGEELITHFMNLVRH